MHHFAFSIKTLITHEEEGNGSRTRVGTDNSANIGDYDLALHMRKFSFNLISELFSIGQAGGIADKAFSIIFCPMISMFFHPFQGFFHSLFLKTDLFSGSQFAVMIHIHERADTQQSTDKGCGG